VKGTSYQISFNPKWICRDVVEVLVIALQYQKHRMG
jgi:hypothetical protein